MVHAEPAENELIGNDNVKQIKSSDTLPPLKVAKKVIKERKENIEIFTSITPTAHSKEQEVLNVVKKDVKVRECNYFLFVIKK